MHSKYFQSIEIFTFLIITSFIIQIVSKNFYAVFISKVKFYLLKRAQRCVVTLYTSIPYTNIPELTISQVNQALLLQKS